MLEQVDTAFENLIQAMEKAIRELRDEAKQALEALEYQRAEAAIAKAKELSSFTKDVVSLQRSWHRAWKGRARRGALSGKSSGRIPRGVKTPTRAYRIPILETLVEMGGRGRVREVLKRVYKKMAKQLNSFDLESLPSNPRSIRWENTAQWCRLEMIRRGLLSRTSPSGIWEITPEGRKYLETHRDVPL